MVVGHADGAAGTRAADGGGELAIRARLAVGDGAQRRPDPLLKRGAARGERQVECPPRAREVFPQLRLGRVEQGRSVLRAVRAEADGRDGGFVRLERQRADGRFDGACAPSRRKSPRGPACRAA